MAYVIVGASASGINAARTLRENDKNIEIILVSKDEYVYSRCILHHFLDGRREIEDLDFTPKNFFEMYNIKWIKGVEVIGIDIKEGHVAIKGWREKSTETAMSFCMKMQEMGVKTIIVTDISKDGAMMGTNHSLYKKLSADLDIQIVASGGVSDIDDVRRLREMDLYAAIIGKAYYTGAIDLREAIEVSE